ncbi:CheR family methyltransferase [Pseudoalteromonas denitrificans]|uniref:Chemotaxis protein methyltransferase n=1 Tax=Pseudoalteromonas denitrificans DSM 6059 TaxID=1123010 RepID=A0A1I1RWG3_9GAMM|nr:protein-glutamate O-methyltransferase CheR [Pseudoalteromonas denitrificans]SFD35853.1 chemotaxis protein methyltransferase CheR [Pseudoalteromonas denitrificans DSM 6059]
MVVDKEFLLTDSEFTHIVDLVYKACGIVLGEHKREMVYSRLARRIRSLKLDNFEQYLDYLDSNKDKEFSHFINAITTNLTSFFREMHHFEFLKNTLVPELIKKNRPTKRVRIWSAGCSTGEEPYSIAMTVANMFPIGWDVKILATDLDSNVLAKASNGEYSANSTTGLEAETLKKWFFKDKQGDNYKVKPELKKMIHFKRLNLLQKWPMKGPFDFIFCRNVVIYFDIATKENLFQNYADILTPDSYLFLGHSESMSKEQKRFSGLGKTIYKKIK